jgi:hypothetical protein
MPAGIGYGKKKKKKTPQPGGVDFDARRAEKKRKEKQKKMLEQLSNKANKQFQGLKSELGGSYNAQQRMKHKMKAAYKKVGL